MTLRLRHTTPEYVRLRVKDDAALEDVRREAIAMTLRNECDVRFEWSGQEYVIRWSEVEARLKGS